MSQDKPLEPDAREALETEMDVRESATTVATADPVPPTTEVSSSRTGQVSKSPMQIAMGRLARDKVAMASLGAILFFVMLAIFHKPIGKIFLKDQHEIDDPTRLFPKRIGRNTLPKEYSSWEHPFGTEPATGKDLFRMWVNGAWPSLTVAIVTAIIVVCIGTTMGLMAGFIGGIVDRVISWIIDFLLSLPFLLVAIAIIPVVIDRFGGKDAQGYIDPERESMLRFIALISVLAVFNWTGLARLVRSQVISLREREFVMAARALGVPVSRILAREILPNLLSTIIVSLSTLIPAFVSAEAGLSFLGVGLKPPTDSWGQTISVAQRAFDTYPIWLWLPVLAIVLLVLSLSLLGDAISDAFNPHTRR